MSTFSTGFQATSNAQSFINLTAPVHLPSLASADGADSPHLPAPHKTQAIEVSGITDIAPERQGVDFGQVDHFKYINNDQECLKSVTLTVKLAPLAAGAGGAHPRYVDDILCAAIDHIDFMYAGKVLQSLYGDEIHFRTALETPHDEISRKYKLQGAGLTVDERVALAAAPQWINLEVPFWWTRSPSASWHQYALQRMTRVVIYWRTPDYLLQQDGGTARPLACSESGVASTMQPYIMDHFLRFNVVCLSEATKQTYIKMVEANGDNGWLYMIPDWERMTDQQLSNGATTTTFLLSNLTKFGYNLRYWIRPLANIQPDWTNNRRWEIIDIKSHALSISGKTFLPPLDDVNLKFAVNGKLYLGNETLPIYNIPFTDYPDLHTHAMGGIEFSNTVNPQITINTSALPYACSADFVLYCHNYVRVVIDGARSTAETLQPL